MKKNLLVTYMVTALLMVFTRCSENEVVTPNEQLQSSAAADERDDESARRNKKSKYISTPVTGTIDGLAFAAEYQITEFVSENEVLYAVGTLNNISGEGLPAQVAALPTQIIKLPVDTGDQVRSADAAGRSTDVSATALACDVLLLNLGPLDLDLLGLTIHLDQVVLEIIAETGAGNLLGNLLCAITGLLDGVAALAAVAELLNQVIDLIGVLPV
jgi:hypothetical protein